MNSPTPSRILLLALLLGAVPVDGAEILVDGKSTAAAPNGTPLAPYKTISAALQVAKPGDRVVIQGGTYREHLAVPSGAENRPLTITAAPGQRVIVSGTKKLTGWKKHDDSIWTTTLDWRPERLMVGFTEQPIARVPNEGWWVMPSFKRQVLTDPEHLKNFQFDVQGAEICVWQAGNRFPIEPVKSLDKTTGTLTLAGQGKYIGKTRDADRYYLRNHVSMIDVPGEWAVEETGGKFKVYFRPADPADLEKVEAPASGDVIAVSRVGHVEINGLEVCGGTGLGINVEQAKDIRITNCVVHHNVSSGIHSVKSERLLVARCVLWCNDRGLGFGRESQDVVAEENDIGYNRVDGFRCSGARNISVRHNYIHDHYFLSHPDNIQLFQGNENVHFSKNLLIASGQAMMMQATTNGIIEGNTLIGTSANMVIFGHDSVSNFKVLNNTLAFTSQHCLVFTDKHYDVRENVFFTGNGNAVYGVTSDCNYTGDRNLFWNLQAFGRRGILGYNGRSCSTIEDFRKASGQDQHSVRADPRFLHAPVSYTTMDQSQNQYCTADTWYIKEDTGLFHVGDVVEVNFDGMPRTVTKVQPETITVSPGLKQKPVRGLRIANWGKDARDLKLDLRLRDDSPGVTLGKEHGRVGSTINIQAYRDGDFHESGRRERPEIPQELLDAVRSL